MYNLNKFDNCISLGWFCGTAASMSRYGLRSHSGPFDWYFSDMESVLKVMETDFSDFMKRENLLLESGKIFRDVKYGFRYPHDVNCDFEMEYPFIYQRYMRRVERFRYDIQSPTCFIRAVKSEEEIKYIEENQSYIERIIKSGNKENEIIFLLLNNMRELPDECLWFRLGIKKYVGESYEMRVMFDSSRNLSLYCKTNILQDEAIKKNIEFDRKKLSLDVKVQHLMHQTDEGNDIIMTVFREFYPNIDQGLFLWGAGYYGNLMLQLFIQNGIKVTGIIDNSPDKIGTLCENIPVISFSEVKRDDLNVFIAISADMPSNEIKKQVMDKYPDTKIYSLPDLAMHPKLSLIF